MEPVKSGSLVNLPDETRAALDSLHGGSPASYAIRQLLSQVAAEFEKAAD